MEYNFEGLEKDQKFIVASKILRENLKITEECFHSKDAKDELYREYLDLEKKLCVATKGAFNMKNGMVIFSIMLNEYTASREYSDLINAYNLILENYHNLANELNINTTYDLSVMCSYLLWNGYFSKTKSHIYDAKNRKITLGFPFDVINGGGVCYEYSILLKDFLDKCSKESGVLFCKFPFNDSKMKRNYKPNIERNFIDNKNNKLLEYILNIISNSTGNHAVTLIDENGQNYIYDLTNLAFFNIIDAKSAAIVDGNGNLNLKPTTSTMICGSKGNLIENLYGQEKFVIEEKQVKEWFEKNIDLLNGNIPLLNDAYDNVHSYMETISAGMSRIKTKKSK